MIQNEEDKNQLPVPRNLCEAEGIINGIHVNLGHQSVRGISDGVKIRLWCPDMTKVVEAVIKFCNPCQPSAPHSLKQITSLRVIERGGPFKKLGMDFLQLHQSLSSTIQRTC